MGLPRPQAWHLMGCSSRCTAVDRQQYRSRCEGGGVKLGRGLLFAAGRATEIWEGRECSLSSPFPLQAYGVQKAPSAAMYGGAPQQYGSTVPSGAGTVGDGSASAAAAGLPQVCEATPHTSGDNTAGVRVLPMCLPSQKPLRLPPRCLSLDARPLVKPLYPPLALLRCPSPERPA